MSDRTRSAEDRGAARPDAGPAGRHDTTPCWIPECGPRSGPLSTGSRGLEVDAVGDPLRGDVDRGQRSK